MWRTLENLNENKIVATVMSNSGFVKSLENIGIDCVQTKVGDRFVYECMQENDYSLGGEQSGHIIVKKYATTGDGILTAIMVVEEMCELKSKLSSLCENVLLYPQLTKNIKVIDKEAVVKDDIVLEAVETIEKKINGEGRVLLRQSGTEPVIRVMVESKSKKTCEEYCDYIIDVIKERGFMHE